VLESDLVEVRLGFVEVVTLTQLRKALVQLKIELRRVVAESGSAHFQSVSIFPNRGRPRESLVLVVVLVLVIGDGAVEDEDEKEDDLVAAPPCRAVSRDIADLP